MRVCLGIIVQDEYQVYKSARLKLTVCPRKCTAQLPYVCIQEIHCIYFCRGIPLVKRHMALPHRLRHSVLHSSSTIILNLNARRADLPHSVEFGLLYVAFHIDLLLASVGSLRQGTRKATFRKARTPQEFATRSFAFDQCFSTRWAVAKFTANWCGHGCLSFT